MRPRNALQQNGQPVVLRHEGPHRRLCRVQPGAHRARYMQARHYVSEANTLLYGQEKVAFGVAGYQEIDEPLHTKACVTWHVAM